MPTHYTRYTSLCLRLRARALYTSNGINYPPVTQAQVDAAEPRLGFQLPPMLRELYTTVANGASFFAPGEWFHGITDNRPGTRPNTLTIDGRVGDGPRPFDTQTVDLLRAHPGSYIVCEGIPAGFVRLTHIGGGNYVFLDGFTGHLYAEDDHYEDDHYEDDGAVGKEFSWCALSLEEWAERNLALSPGEGYLEGKYLPRYPLAKILENTGANASGGDQMMTPKIAHSRGSNLPASQATSQQEAEGVNLLERLRIRLRSMREEVVRQIHQLDNIVASAQSLSTRHAQEFADSQAIERLADAEAQIYALEDETRFPE